MNQVDELLFADANGMLYGFTEKEVGPEIQFAYEIGLIVGNGQDQFEPDRPITRQEAAHHYLLLTKPTLNVTGGETETSEEPPLSE